MGTETLRFETQRFAADQRNDSTREAVGVTADRDST
jgi:hypothetical protein